MREKKNYLVVSFYTTAAAMALEKRCRENAVPGRLAPVPRELSSDCGIAFLTEPAYSARLTALAEGLEVDTITELLL